MIMYFLIFIGFVLFWALGKFGDFYAVSIFDRVYTETLEKNNIPTKTNTTAYDHYGYGWKNKK